MFDGAPRDESVLPAIDAELLYGTAMIGRWLGLTEGQARALIDDGTIPTFRMPGRSARCAIKSELNETFRDYANRPGAREKAPARRQKTTA
jgi:hypothetical protein